MSGDCQREMTLDEWVERLPEIHSARKEYAALKAMVEKFTSTNTARDEICPHYQRVLYVDVCTCAGKLSPVA